MASLLREVVAAVRGNLVAAVASLVGGAILFVAALAWTPLAGGIQDRWAERRNIDADTALTISRRQVGAGTIWAVPFRNRNDPTQYIAVWHDASGADTPCYADTATAKPDWCNLQLAHAELDLLVGDGDIFERIPTHLTAGTAAGGPSVEIAQSPPASVWRELAPFWGIVDRDGDGRKEILSIASSTGTHPVLPRYVSLYETEDGAVRQLRVFPSRSATRYEFVNVADPGLRQWLSDRYREFEDAGEDCDRAMSGELSCSTINPPAEVNASEDAAFARLFDAQQAWIDTNGVDFTHGPQTVQWQPGRHVEDGACVHRRGDHEWLNVFKGPLVVNDLASDRMAVVYVQDGQHHREVPTVVFGRRYIWLAAAVGEHILAIDPQTFEIERVYIPEFAGGPPALYGQPGERLTHESDPTSPPLKDVQLDGLDVRDGQLHLGDISLSVPAHIGAHEFVGAALCPDHEA